MSKNLLHDIPVVLILLLWNVGCSMGTNEIARFAVQGEVSFEGKPVSNGTITLEPDPGKGNKGPASIGIIQDGKFNIPATRGIVGGAYIARITGYGPLIQSSGAEQNFGPPLFSDYEIHLELPAKKLTQEFHIPAEKQ